MSDCRRQLILAITKACQVPRLTGERFWMERVLLNDSRSRCPDSWAKGDRDVAANFIVREYEMSHTIAFTGTWEQKLKQGRGK